MLNRLIECLEPSFTRSSMTARLTSITVGRVKDKHLSAICIEFARKLGRYSTFKEIELRDAKRGRLSLMYVIRKPRKFSGDSKNAYVIALDERGQ